MPKDDILSKICTREDVDWQLASLPVPDNPDEGASQKAWQRKLKALPVLRLRLAVDLPRDSVERLCVWVRRQVAPEAILDIEVDPSLIAGAQISWRGKYVDLSKKEELDQILDSERTGSLPVRPAQGETLIKL